MKTLIENLTSDLLPNQIFQTGFSFLIILKGNSLLKLDSNVLISLIPQHFDLTLFISS